MLAKCGPVRRLDGLLFSVLSPRSSRPKNAQFGWRVESSGVDIAARGLRQNKNGNIAHILGSQVTP